MTKMLWHTLFATGVFACAIAGCAGIPTGPVAAVPVYTIQPHEVCTHQHHTGAYTLDKSNPYGWSCYNLAYSISLFSGFTFTPKGSLNMQAYCTAQHQGTRAVVSHQQAQPTWQCVPQHSPSQKIQHRTI